MFGSTPKPFPAPTRDRLDKLIRRMASDSDGEVVATARAIARTLTAAGLDWHDLAVRVTAMTGAELLANIETTAPSWSARPYSPPPSPPEPQKSPWPTWGNVGGQRERVRWMQAVKTTKEYVSMRRRLEFDDLLAKVYQRPHERVSRKEINLFNIVVRVAWEFGLRLNEGAAA